LWHRQIQDASKVERDAPGGRACRNMQELPKAQS
jgi:hypothetical protein